MHTHTVQSLSHASVVFLVSTIIEAHLFASVNVNDLVLIHIFKDVGSIHQDADGANRCHYKEHVELQAINHHCDKLPVFSYLYVFVLIPKMLSNELHSLCGPVGLW